MGANPALTSPSAPGPQGETVVLTLISSYRSDSLSEKKKPPAIAPKIIESCDLRFPLSAVLSAPPRRKNPFGEHFLLYFIIVEWASDADYRAG